mgnify:CR=1 FL=1
MSSVTKKLFGWIPNGIPCLLLLSLLFGYLGREMGAANMLNTIMKTAHDLLLNTCFYLMGICVITGALGKVFVEFVCTVCKVFVQTSYKLFVESVCKSSGYLVRMTPTL